MKKALIIVLVVVVLIVLAAVLFLPDLDALIAKAIEKEGGKVTQTGVHVSGVEISLREGRGTIKELTVASPEGFDVRDAFTLEEITLDIDIGSLRKDPIVIDELRIKAPVVNAEFTKSGSSNIEKIRESVNAYTARSGGQPDGEEKLIRIKQFVFEEGRVEIDMSSLGLENRTLKLPGIRLVDVGGEGGAPPAEIAKIILTAVVKQASSEMAGSQIDRMVEEKLGGSITDKAKGLLDKIQ